MANLMIQVGRAVTKATTGSVANVVPGACKLLGFWANAGTETVTIYDEGASPAGASGDVQIAITGLQKGWNPCPLDLNNGLSVNQSAQLYYVIQA